MIFSFVTFLIMLVLLVLSRVLIKDLPRRCCITVMLSTLLGSASIMQGIMNLFLLKTFIALTILGFTFFIIGLLALYEWHCYFKEEEKKENEKRSKTYWQMGFAMLKYMSKANMLYSYILYQSKLLCHRM